MQKIAQQIAYNVAVKLGFAVTERGHEFDADVAEMKRKFFTDLARRQQEEGAVGYRDPDTEKTNWGNILSALRFGGGDALGAARHQAYTEKQHREGSNAWNPFGGMLTPIPEERGATTGLLGQYGKVE